MTAIYNGASDTMARLSWPLARQATVAVGLVLALLALGAEIARYIGLGAYLDHIEGNVVISAWQFAHGNPLYELRDGLPRFSTFYGPLAYLVELPALAISPTIMASKLLSLLAVVASLVLICVHWRRRQSAEALHGVFFFVAGLLLFSPTSFWVRPDSFEVLLVTAAIICSPSPIGVGICLGLLVNLKAHAFVYFLPIAIDLWMRGGWRTLPKTALAAAIVFLVPFLVTGISLTDYLAGLAQQVGNRGLRAAQMVPVLIYLASIAAGLVLPLARRDVTREARLYGWAALVTLVLLFFPATVTGSGAYHILPLVPILAEARVRLRPRGIGAEFAPFLMLFFAALGVQHNLAMMADRAGWHAIAADAVAVARRSESRTVQIGYGDSQRAYDISQLSRVELALAGYPVLLDAQVLMELRAVGFDGSRRWVPDLEQCRITRWLLPKDEEPFALRSFFYDGGPLFDDSFRHAFLAHYRRVGESADFAVWECLHEQG